MDRFDKGDYGDKFSTFFHYFKDLGQGSYGKVVKALDKYTRNICAVKIIKKRSLTEDQVKDLREEALVLSKLQHPNIVSFMGVKESNTRIFIIMEYIRKGTLASYMKKKKVSQQKSRKIMTDILKAVNYLHNCGIVHRDLKPENILISSSKVLNVKIADFGLSTHVEAGFKVEECCGTIVYMAPEQAAKKAYSKEVDVWSCGIILFMLLNSGIHPLYTQNETKDSYFKKLANPKWVFPSHFPSLAANLFNNLTKQLPIERYTVSQALAHPWISGEHKEIPKTYLENMRIYDAEIKLRCISYIFMFCAINVPQECRYSREPVQKNVADRRKTFSAKGKDEFSRIRHFKTCYENLVSKSPIRLASNKQRLKYKY